MHFKHANQRFATVMITSMVVFLAACLAMTWADKFTTIPKPALWVSSIVPVVALLMPIWAQWRYVNEIDEFLRSIQMKAIFGGLGVTLLLASSWGFVEMYVDAPSVSMFWLNPVYWIAYSIGAMYFSRRAGVKD